MITKEILLNNGYKHYKQEVGYNNCDAFYQKTLNNVDGSPVKCINALYYVFNDSFEFELIEEHNGYWNRNLIYAINSDMKIEEIENILLTNSH